LKKTAVLLDLGFLLHKLRPILGNRQATALEVRDFALRCLQTDRVILVTADSDFVPAMKFARREGVQVVLVTMGHTLVKRELRFMPMNYARSFIRELVRLG